MANVLSIVSYHILPASLGGQKCIHLLNKYISETHKVICVGIKNNDATCADGYTMLPILTNSRLRYINIFYVLKFRRLIKEHQISHVILEHPYFGWLGVLLKWFFGVKLIIHSHNIEAYRFRSLGSWWWRLLWVYEKYTHRLADATFNITPEDRQYMIDKFKMKPSKCSLVTYGIERSEAPSQEDRVAAKQRICENHGLSINNLLYFYNGTLNYMPNLNGVKAILYQILPRFTSSRPFKIIICGKYLPEEFNDLADYKDKNIVYAGFVEDINLYFKGTDIFINPVTDGAGIKTKLVEALGHDLTTVSSRSGAFGVDEKLCNGKLLLAKDDDWDKFTHNMLLAQKIDSHIDDNFYDHFNYRRIGQRAAQIISNL
jgi:polysaccharide biosynthesis protein PslH